MQICPWWKNTPWCANSTALSTAKKAPQHKEMFLKNICQRQYGETENKESFTQTQTQQSPPLRRWQPEDKLI